MTRTTRLICWSSLLLALASGCRTDAPDELAAADSTRVPDSVYALDGLRADTVGVDTLRAAAPGDSARVDTLGLGAGAADSTALSPSASVEALPAPPGTGAASAVDSLVLAVARLTATVEVLQRANLRLLEDRLEGEPGEAEADTLAAEPAERVREAAEGLPAFALSLFWAIVILIGAFFVVRFGAWLLESLAERNAAQRLFFKRLLPIFRLLVWAGTIYFVLTVVFEVDRQGLLAASAALGVAVGFAAQDILKNIFGGIIIIFDQPFQVGDKIAVGGTYGEVVSIGLRSTRIVTPDDNLVSVPNSQIVDTQVANANAGALDCQVVTDLYLPGWVDVALAKRIAYEAAANSRYVYLEKPVVVMVKDEFDEMFLTHLKVKAYVLDTRYEFAFASDVTETAKAEFLRHGLLQPIYPAHFMAEMPRGAAPAGDGGRV